MLLILLHMGNDFRTKHQRIQVLVMEKNHGTCESIVPTTSVASDCFNDRSCRHAAHIEDNLLSRREDHVLWYPAEPSSPLVTLGSQHDPLPCPAANPISP